MYVPLRKRIDFLALNPTYCLGIFCARRIQCPCRKTSVGAIKMLKDLAGCTFGRVTVISRVENDAKGQSQWLCRCECGRESVLRSDTARAGCNRKCGCSVVAVSRGFTRHPLCSVWTGMMHRCYSPNHSSFRYYGGRGITVCERWHKLENFLADMGDRPAGTSIDRIDVNGNYCPENCRWATSLEQARNRRKNYRLEVGGVEMTLYEAAATLGLTHGTLWSRLQRGWTPSEAGSPKRQKWSRQPKGPIPQRLMKTSRKSG